MTSLAPTADAGAFSAARLSVVSTIRSVVSVARDEKGSFALVLAATIWGITTAPGQALVVAGTASIPWLLRGDAAWQYRARFHGCSPARLLQLQSAAAALVASIAVGLGRLDAGAALVAVAALLVNGGVASALPMEIGHRDATVMRRSRFSLLNTFLISIVRARWLACAIPLAGGLAFSQSPAVVLGAMIWLVLVLTRAMVTRPRDVLLEAAADDGRRHPVWTDVRFTLTAVAAVLLPLIVAGLVRSSEVVLPMAIVVYWAAASITLATLLARRPASGMSAEVIHFLVVLLAAVPPIAAWIGARLWRAARQER